jgi:hypothetical protein
LTFEQFHYAFANAVSDDEAKELFDRYAVAAAGEPLFQAAFANINPWTEAKVDHENVERGPMLIMSGEKDPAEKESGRDGVRRDPGTPARLDHRQRLARGGRHRAHIRQAVGLLSSRGSSRPKK